MGRHDPGSTLPAQEVSALPVGSPDGRGLVQQTKQVNKPIHTASIMGMWHRTGILTSWWKNRSGRLRRWTLLRRWVLTVEGHNQVSTFHLQSTYSNVAYRVRLNHSPERAQRARLLVHLIHPRVRWQAARVPVIIPRVHDLCINGLLERVSDFIL